LYKKSNLDKQVSSATEKLQLGRLALARALSKAGRKLVSIAQQLWWPGKIKLIRIAFAPQELRTSDPTVAADIYAGYFAFSGQNVATQGNSPFDITSPGPNWSEALYSFNWLRHLKAADTALARDNARTLIDDFIARRRDRDPVSIHADVTARRLIAWLANAPLIIERADHTGYTGILGQMERDISQLRLECRSGTYLNRLYAAIALTYASLCLEGAEKLGLRAQTVLAEELDHQILPDGGHISRNPRILIDLLLDLLPLRGIYAARGLDAPRALLGAIDRMLPMLRMLRHGDGDIIVMNGMGATRHDILSTLTAYDDARARPSEHASYSGYLRLEAGATTLIADVGPPPPVQFSAEATAGTLAFELSFGAQKIVVNCGFPRGAQSKLLKMARSTAASSTLVLDDTSSAHFVGLSGEVLIMTAANAVDVTRGGNPGSPSAEARHDGYRERFGFDHIRRWQLEQGGAILTGEDTLIPQGRVAVSMPVTLRFHLNQGIRTSLFQKDTAAVLALPGHEVWTFDANGLPINIEESVSFAASDGHRRTEQLVVSALAPPEGLTILWRFARVGHQPKDETARTMPTDDQTGN
jgi:uncharacterized heparinase superfamily protein